jgi:hypothetical protein
VHAAEVRGSIVGEYTSARPAVVAHVQLIEPPKPDVETVVRFMLACLSRSKAQRRQVVRYMLDTCDGAASRLCRLQLSRPMPSLSCL